MYQKSSFATWFFNVALTLKTAHQYFWNIIWLMMMHHRKQFRSIRFSISEDSILINGYWHFENLPWPWPWTQQSNSFIGHSGLWQCTIKASIVAKGSATQKIIVETVIFDHTCSCCDLDLENSKQIFSRSSPAHNDASQYQVWWQNVWRFRRYYPDKHRHFDPLLWPWSWMQ